MPNCLGIYTENNIIKYAKLNADKNGRFFETCVLWGSF